MKLELTNEEAAFIVSVLNQLPNSSNSWPLKQKIEAQIVEQTQQPQQTE